MRRTANPMAREWMGRQRWCVVAMAVVLLAASMVHAKDALTIDQARAAFALAEAPAAALTIGDALTLLEKAPKNRASITMVGRIAAREGEDPFFEGKASFVLMDLPDDDHSASKGHDADNCPFCKRRQAKAALAAVQFVDADGAVVAIDSRQLFGLKKGAKVVVRGQASYNPKLPFPIVQLDANGIHVLAESAK
jgi:hypothetical protein